MFLLRSTGQTILPDEAYLGWQNELGESVRSLNMPGYVATFAATLREAEIELRIVGSPEEAIRPSQLIIAATTTTEGYIPLAWLQAGAILVNVSLDDPLPEVVLRADSVIVDDWMLVKNDPRRLIGRMYRAGQVIGPDEKMTTRDQPCRRIDAELADIVVGSRIGRRSMQDIILINPFGMAIEDIALATRVYQRARELNLGLWLDR